MFGRAKGILYVPLFVVVAAKVIAVKRRLVCDSQVRGVEVAKPLGPHLHVNVKGSGSLIEAQDVTKVYTDIHALRGSTKRLTWYHTDRTRQRDRPNKQKYSRSLAHPSDLADIVNQP